MINQNTAMIMWIGLFIGALTIVIKSADFFVAGAASTARRLGMSAFVVGLTIVAIGTSAPEVTVNTIAAFQGNTSLSIGNIIGSNIVNILLGLGVAALFVPLTIKKQTVWKELPFMLLAALMVLVLGADTFFGTTVSQNVVGRSDGLVLLSFFAIFLVYVFGLGKPEGEEEDIAVLPWWQSLALIGAGLTGLVVGGKFAVQAAVEIAHLLHLSENLIGLTIVAIGTSLPEIVTSVTAVRKGHIDMAVGGIVGSSIFNIFFALGLTALVANLPFTAANIFDAFVLAAVTVVLFVSMFLGRRHTLERWQGALFVGMYGAYIIFAILRG